MRQTTSAAQMLDAAIENAVIAAEPGLQIEDQAKRLISEETEIIEALTPEWQIREVVRLLRMKRLEFARKDQPQKQFLLPGFERVPQRILIRDGKRKPLEGATYRQLRDYFKALRKRAYDNAKLTQVKALMELVWKYAQDTPAITVKQVCEREAQK
jgi:hypothetical protein